MDHTPNKNKYKSQRKRKRITYFRKLNQYKAYANMRKHKRKLIRKDAKKSLNVNCLNNTSAVEYNGEYLNNFMDAYNEYYVSVQHQMKIKPFLKPHKHHHKLPAHDYNEQHQLHILQHKEKTILSHYNFKYMYKHNESHPVLDGWNKYGKEQFVTFAQLKQMKATTHTFSGIISNDMKYIHFDDIGMNDKRLWNKKLILGTLRKIHLTFYTLKRVLFKVKFDEFLYFNNRNILSWEDCSAPFDIRFPSLSQEIMCMHKRYLLINGYISICGRMYDIFIPNDIQIEILSYFSQLASNQLHWISNCAISHFDDHFLIRSHQCKHNVAMSQYPLQVNKEYTLKIRVLRRASIYNSIGIISCSQNSLFEYLNEHEFDRCNPWDSGYHDLGSHSFFEFESGFYADNIGDMLLMKVTVENNGWFVKYCMTLYKGSENSEEWMVWKRNWFYSNKECHLAVCFYGNWWRNPAIEIW